MKKKEKKGYFIRFLPYYGRHKGTLIIDLLCCAFTAGAELVLPLIARYVTSAITGDDPASLTVSLIITIGLCYLGLRLLDALAEFYKSSFGHIMGAKLRRICEKIYLRICSFCPIPTMITPKLASL